MAHAEGLTSNEPRTLTDEDMTFILAEYERLAESPKPTTDWRDSARKVHYTELQPSRAGEPTAEAWDVYRREIGRFLAEGKAGKFVVIRGTEVIGFRDTFAEAYAESERRFPGEDVLIYDVLEYHPVIKLGRAGAWLG